RIEYFSEPLGIAILRAVRSQPHAAVDVPTENEERLARLDQRRAHRTEIILSVHEEGQPAGALDAPAIVAGPQQRRPSGVRGGGRRRGGGGERVVPHVR